MESWIDKVLEQTKESEAPKSFFYWSALCAISAVVKRNIYLDRHLFQVYPNIYVMLIARSGLKKSLPVALARKLVRMVGNTRVLSGRSSVQKMVTELSSVAHLENGVVLNDSCAFITNSEFSSSLVEDPAALTILTDLYDGNFHEEWMNMLKSSGKEVLKDINITMLSATNQTHLKETIKSKDIEGGFIGRTFMVEGKTRNTLNSLVYAPTIKLDYNDLKQHLFEISQVKGEFKWAPDAGKYFHEWYNKIITGASEDTTGTFERIDNHVIKVAMLLHLGRSLDLVLEVRDIEEAIEACSPFVGTAREVTQGQGRNTLAPTQALILKDLLEKQTISRKDLMNKYWGDINAVDLTTIMNNLSEAGAVKLVVSAGIAAYQIDSAIYQKYWSLKGGTH